MINYCSKVGVHLPFKTGLFKLKQENVTLKYLRILSYPRYCHPPVEHSWMVRYLYAPNVGKGFQEGKHFNETLECNLTSYSVVSVQGAARVNVALSGTAKQSSTDTHFEAGPAGRAIDGNDDQDHDAHTWSSTYRERKPWWRVQLPGVYKVAEIEVTAFRESNMKWINAQILIGNSPENNGNNNPR